MAPLDGLKVLELGQLIAAPLCGLQLLDLGADVLKVEPPSGDAARALPPHTAAGDSLFFEALNRGKRGRVVERGDEAALRELIGWADVVVENMAGALAVDHAHVADEHPGLIWCAITGRGVGNGGRAMDPSLQATMGLMALTGEQDGTPLRVPVPLIDVTTGLAATQAVLAALIERGRSGRGQLLDIALLDSAAALTTFAGVSALAGEPPARLGSASALAVPSRVYATADGHVQAVALTERQWRALCQGLGHPEWASDPRTATLAGRLENRLLVDGWLAGELARRTTAGAVAAIESAGGLAAPVRDISEAWTNPELRERGLLGSVGDTPLPTLSLTRAREANPRFTPGPRLG